MRVLRGGSWVNPGRDLRAAYRDRATARLRFNTQGFRCVLPSEPY
jgi:formylglycine-generating enzyme required for sulfatase activity